MVLRNNYDSIGDLTQLNQLDSTSVISCLRTRYKQKQLYTWAGPTLVALNPLREMPDLYSKKVMQMFAHESFTYKTPHIFALGQKSLRHLQWGLGKTHQAIVINGESGAGKTKSALYLLSYLAAMETNNNELENSENIEVLVCRSNPLLEALGNAQTLRNENSSRFGKLIRLVYTGEGAGTELVSAHIETYLLESTRVARQARGERNFHIFYQMLACLPDELKEELDLKRETNWSIASARDCNAIDEAEFRATVAALHQLNLGDVVHDLWKLLAALLHLGNVTFNAGNQPGVWLTEEVGHLESAARLLGVSSIELFNVMTMRNFQAGTRSPAVVRPCSSTSDCSARRDTLIKLLYRLTFDMVLERINSKLKNNVDSCRSNCKNLCILDLYGFESFTYGNSLEQLCINYANERLQYYFTIHYLKDQQLYLDQEGLASINLDVNIVDKQNLISFLDGPVSVFGVLNEECYLNRGCDDSQVCIRIQQSLNERTKGVKTIPPSSKMSRNQSRAPPTEFAINHYAGLVTYSTVSMLEKNRDHIPGELINVLSKSHSHFVRHLIGKGLAELNTTHTMNGRRHTVLAKFKNSLDSLMKTLNTCDVNYVRCIRPSLSTTMFPNSPSQRWDEEYVDSQLNACGVIDTVKVSSFGFPIRMSIEEFASRYRFLVSNRVDWFDLRELCQAIVNSYGRMQEEIRIGLSLVYATECGIELIEQWKHRTRNQMASVIQRWWREIIRRRHAAQAIQRWWRLVLRRKAAVRLQTWWRRRKNAEVMLVRLQRLCRSVRIVQRSVRKWYHVSKYRKMLLQRQEELERSLAASKEPEEPEETRPVEEQVIPEKVAIIQSAKPAQLPGILLLELSRFNYFYSDGILTMRRPPAARVKFFTRKTCLPYSYVPPRSQLPSGLLDAL